MTDEKGTKFTEEQKKGILEMYHGWLFGKWAGRMIRKLWIAVGLTITAVASMAEYLIKFVRG